VIHSSRRESSPFPFSRSSARVQSSQCVGAHVSRIKRLPWQNEPNCYTVRNFISNWPSSTMYCPTKEVIRLKEEYLFWRMAYSYTLTRHYDRIILLYKDLLYIPRGYVFPSIIHFFIYKFNDYSILRKTFEYFLINDLFQGYTFKYVRLFFITFEKSMPIVRPILI
jgi:hypothetical protein